MQHKLKQMSKDKSNENSQFLKVLVSNQKRLQDEINKTYFSRDHLERNIQEKIEKKKHKIEIIQEQIEREFNENCTFEPVIHSVSKRRELEQFLEDQENFRKKLI